ncbi:MAG TPA: hypothetical protein VE818_09840 [Nitrososphaeraceae archaeon]|nr:hypothetical protein [Nitrososphaeraceae archaeon]
MKQTSDGGNNLASSDEETKQIVAKAAGEAPHYERGLRAADE